MRYRVVVHADPGGGYWAEVPALGGCVSEGDTLPETLENIQDAAAGIIRALVRAGRPLPPEDVLGTDEDVVLTGRIEVPAA